MFSFPDKPQHPITEMANSIARTVVRKTSAGGPGCGPSSRAKQGVGLRDVTWSRKSKQWLSCHSGNLDRELCIAKVSFHILKLSMRFYSKLFCISTNSAHVKRHRKGSTKLLLG